MKRILDDQENYMGINNCLDIDKNFLKKRNNTNIIPLRKRKKNEKNR